MQDATNSNQKVSFRGVRRDEIARVDRARPTLPDNNNSRTLGRDSSIPVYLALYQAAMLPGDLSAAGWNLLNASHIACRISAKLLESVLRFSKPSQGFPVSL
jgi:hypothetical protein